MGGRPWRGENVRYMSPATGTNGYPVTTLSRPGKNWSTSFHNVVAAAFLGPRPEGHQINHLDGNKGNPRAANLEYCTKSSNMRHAIDVLKRKIGYPAQHTVETVLRVKNLFASGKTEPEISRLTGLPRSSVHWMRSSKCWSHVQASVETQPRPRRTVRGANHPLAKIRETSAAEIRQRRADGEKVADLAVAFGIGVSQVYRIMRNQAWV